MAENPECDRARAELTILYVADRDRGVERTESDYLRMFPGCEAAISEEWHRLEVAFPNGIVGDGTTGSRPSPARSDGPRKIGPYRVERELGRGAQGTVFLAHDTQVGRQVALKILKPAWSGTSAAKRFALEARALARVDHPGIATVYDAGSAHGLQYFAMRYVEGHTLATELASRAATARPDREAVLRFVALLERCARALHVAHQGGLVHRDVKPANLMITAGDDPVVLDFGVALSLDAGAEALTTTGDVLGTPDFMAPEQVAGDRARIDRRTDVFGLGMTLRAAAGGGRRRNPAVTRELDTVLRVASDPEPDRRYATAAAFADDLARVLRGAPVAVRPPGRLALAARWVRRAPAAAALLIVPPVMLTGGLAALAGQNAAIRRSARELVAAEAEANAAERAATERTAAFQRLEDLRLVEELDRRQRALWPATPSLVPDLERWLLDAGSLLDRLPGHRAALAQLRERATPGDPGDGDPDADPATRARRVLAAAQAELATPGLSDGRRASMSRVAVAATDKLASRAADEASRPAWRFERVEDQWLHDNLEQLVELLEQLDGSAASDASHATDALGMGTQASVRERLDVARSLTERTLVRPAATWREAVAAIANPETDPAYAGLLIRPVLGLVPLGRDPDSLLWEFAHLPSGAPPARDARGRLVLDEESSLVLVLLPGGTVRIGARPPLDADELALDYVDPAAREQEQPVHEVALAPYFLSKYEMTQRQWMRVAGSNPSHARPDRAWDHGYAPTLQNPVEQVSFLECAEVLFRYGLALPTEAQWEAAARGGTTTPWWCGETVASFLASENLADLTFVETEQVSGRFDPERRDGWSGPAPVGSYPGNPFGLHDVIGNVSEWCVDHIEFYKIPALAGDGLRAGGSSFARAVRGGSFNDWARNARSAYRFGMHEATRAGWLGVRPALALQLP